jgi:uncharacterized membrane protein YhaH (DUF805 family)
MPSLQTSPLAAAIALAGHILDFRGRCNRKGLLVVAGLLLGAEALTVAAVLLLGVDQQHAAVLALKALFVWTAFTAASKRLHDLGHSAWAILWTFGAICLWSAALTLVVFFGVGEQALLPQSSWYMGILVATIAPVFAATLWLHLAKGEAGANRFGPVPEGIGFSRGAAGAGPGRVAIAGAGAEA